MDVWTRPVGLVDGRRIVLGLGCVYLLLGFWWAIRVFTGGTESVANLYISLFIVGPAVALLYGGFRLPRTDIAPDQYAIAARASFGAIGLMVVLLGLFELQPDGGLENPIQSVLALTALASVAGFSAGLYDAKAKTRARELEERNQELRQAQQQLTAVLREVNRTNEQLDEFASVVSHDLRNPLLVAEGNLELIRQDCENDRLDAVADAHDRMGVLIDDLLTLAREGNQVSETEPVDVADLAQQGWQVVDTADATLVTDTEKTILADRSRLRQILENLIRNAVEHGGANVTVTVGDVEDGFFVEDDGPGIQPDDHDDVLETGYSTSPTGTGFGLSIVKQIAEAHGWDLHVTDSSQGGARFEITSVETVQSPANT